MLTGLFCQSAVQDIDTEWLEQAIMGALMERHLLSELAELYFEQHFSGGKLLLDVPGLCCDRTQQTPNLDNACCSAEEQRAVWSQHAVVYALNRRDICFVLLTSMRPFVAYRHKRNEPPLWI